MDVGGSVFSQHDSRLVSQHHKRLCGMRPTAGEKRERRQTETRRFPPPLR
uniref:Uncharacterized protein n=1 Tax=Anguilla anguilla TaxID=7936 RepID=A0A0E9Y0T2_ANGAN